MAREWAWVRMKMDGDKAIRPLVFELVIGTSWGDRSSRVITEHTDQREAMRLADFFNKANDDSEKD